MYEIIKTVERIKYMLKVNNTTSKELLENCGLNKNTLSSMQSRGSWPQANNLAKIADYLGCSIDYLVGRTNNPEINKNIIEAIPMRTINLYDMPASAGTGTYLHSDSASDFLIPDIPENKIIDCAIRVSGNSMVPLYNDGDIVLVSQRMDIRDGDVGIFIADGEGYIKKYRLDRLESVNPDYDDIYPKGKTILLFGKVIRKFDTVPQEEPKTVKIQFAARGGGVFEREYSKEKADRIDKMISEATSDCDL